ncbi:MAG: PIN domain-containing protein [Firmicutes bacterium]|nr:PIN domain-containing protein [Bacillota bacterium]
MILIDTNVLVYAINADAPQHGAARAFVEAARAGRWRCGLVPQVLLEFFAVVTDGRRVASPLTPGEALEQVAAWRAIFPVFEVGKKALDYLPEVLAEKPVKGGGIFDAWLVAQMRAADMETICTYNPGDLTGYEGIRPVTPEEIIG